jgi:uncharacterized lipoprotein YmbA
MHPGTFNRTALFVFVAAAMVLLGCAHTEPSRFYVLTAAAEQPAGAADDGPPVSIAVVRVAEYLDRESMVTRHGENELRLAEFDRWGEPLTDGISRVLAENLSRLLASESFSGHPLGEPGLSGPQVVVSVEALDARPGDQLILRARWRAVSDDGKELVPSRRFTTVEAIVGEDAAALVAAHSRALAALSRDIAEAMGQIQATTVSH